MLRKKSSAESYFDVVKECVRLEDVVKVQRVVIMILVGMVFSIMILLLFI